ncbi:TraB/TrbI/VirB10 family type IV secretion system protein [Sphingosinicella rhizophila]|uniref:TrbI/VirB10 family protein n=1 Tax=Sphingosinicella rhizophila TaxID=3050082 RepID=A0ABU3Q5L8_9SPHN|nr:TrbI/VirB10 family protein [Sphingosinicella sp. GR2756]MDT9598592.1 TrbI/VirB10 family protein [Sphingosinicella sp. GR2756]
MTDTPNEPPVAAKVDPETLVLRGTPSRVVRFRRGAIVAIAALGSTAIVGVAWLALKPATFRVLSEAEDRTTIGAKAPADALANAPRSYGDVPQLGPPLPGDLGRPILKHQRSMEAATQPAGPDQIAQAAEAERQRIAAEGQAARESGVMMQLGGGNPATPAQSIQENAVPATAENNSKESLSLDPDKDPNGQQRKADFVGRKDASGDINPHGLVSAPSPWTLSAGSVIAASLITGLNSDLPGLVTAQVTENAYDSFTGRTLLVPQGSRLMGSYDSVVAFGQKRALVVWQRIILPDGSSIRIDNVPATDTAGYAGLADKVDAHTWQLLKGVALSTLLGVGTELTVGSTESDLVQAIRESAQQSGARAGDQLVSRNLNVQPTIRVRPGWSLRVVVHKDIVLRPWRAEAR